MRFASLTNPSETVTFQEAVQNGVSEDGGLYVPQAIPRLKPEEIEGLVGANLVDIGKTMLRPYVEGEVSEAALDTIVRQAATFDIPLVDVDDRKVLEVFHGPTGAFKDVAARYLGAFMNHFFAETGQRSTIQVATSGDTGGAIAAGLGNMPGVDVVLSYPKDRVSNLQLEQLRRVAPNVHSLEIDGSFDDCLALTEAAFADPELNRALNLTSANSLNVGRLLPQTTFHARIYSGLGEEAGRTLVPTGNGGDLVAGVITYLMGVPSKGRVGVNNANDRLAHYLESGRFEPAASVSTLSSAMDIGNPRNVPRLQWLAGNDIARLRELMTATSVSDEETVTAIREVYDRTGYVLDPHTAVAWTASQPGDVVIATASPAKFAEEIYEQTGIDVDNSAELAALRQIPERYTELPNAVEPYKDFLRGMVR